MCLGGFGQEDYFSPHVCIQCFDLYPGKVGILFGEPGIDKGWFPTFGHMNYHVIVKHPEYYTANWGEEQRLRLKARYEKELGL